jgi:L-iditol 2-dehydrogenase
MRAVKLYGARDLRVEEVSPPTAGPGQVVVRIEAVGVCGSDLHYYLDGHIGDTVATEPLVLGHEFAGTISEIGFGVRGLTIGQRVAVDPAIPCGHCEFCLEGNPNTCPDVRFCGTPPTDGAFQSTIAWPADLVFPLPDSIDAASGAVLEALGVAIHAVDLGKIRLAQRVAVFGCGPIGIMIAKLAKLSGAVEVYGSDVNPKRLAAASDYALDVAIDARAEDAVARVRELTGGRGVDVAFETAGVLETPQQCVDAVKPAGTVVVVGICPEDRIPIKSTAARRKGVTIKLCRRMKHVYPRAIDLVSHGLLDLAPLITHRYPLERTADAFADVARPDTAVVKAVVEVS